MFTDPGRNLFVLLVIIVVGWFALGTQLNIRRGNQVLRWLQDGLTRVGQKTTLRWLGSSAIELKLQEARKPLRQVEIFILMEPRDVPFLWWFYRARGRRDLLIIRCQLQAMPGFELEALDTRAWSTRGIEREARSKEWQPLATSSRASLVVYTEGGAHRVPELLELAAIPELSLARLAVHRSVPNLEVQWNLVGFGKLPSERVFERLQEIAARL